MDEFFSQKVYKKTEELIGRLDFIRMSVLAIISAVFVTLFFYIVSFPITRGFILLIIGFSYLYAFVRDIIVTRHNKKVMSLHFDYTIKKRPNIDLYIPIFYRTNQVFTPRKASLFIAKDVIYLEAYKRASLRTRFENSNVARCNRDFYIYDYTVSGSGKYVTYKARLANTAYNFSVINDKELIDIIERFKEN